jgi:hypothetical protein
MTRPYHDWNDSMLLNSKIQDSIYMTHHYSSQPGGPEGAGGYIYIYRYSWFLGSGRVPMPFPMSR